MWFGMHNNWMWFKARNLYPYTNNMFHWRLALYGCLIFKGKKNSITDGYGSGSVQDGEGCSGKGKPAVPHSAHQPLLLDKLGRWPCQWPVSFIFQRWQNRNAYFPCCLWECEVDGSWKTFQLTFKTVRDFSVAMTQGSQCRRPRFYSWSGN